MMGDSPDSAVTAAELDKELLDLLASCTWTEEGDAAIAILENLIAHIAALRRERDEARERHAISQAVAGDMASALDDARADCAKKDAALREAERAFDEVAEAYLKAGNNQGAGALQYAARYISDILAALAPAAQGHVDAPDIGFGHTDDGSPAPAPSAGETDKEDVKTELRFWLGWAHRRLSPIHASYIPARFLLAAAPTTGEPTND